jgi:NAD+ diphosphatase
MPLVRSDTSTLPTFGDQFSFMRASDETLFIGSIGNTQFFASKVPADIEPPDGWCFTSLRSLFGIVAEDLVAAIGTAIHLLEWDANSQFCGRCSAATALKEDERAKLCPECGLLIFPRISPAIIVAVLDHGRILLGCNKRHTKAMYSLVAGFVEAGENLEQAVKREIREEVSVEVENIQYWGSQPWPFPDSLMIGFTAEYKSGAIKVDGEELIDAGWFSPDSMPLIPPCGSISRKIIDWFTQGEVIYAK